MASRFVRRTLGALLVVASAIPTLPSRASVDPTLKLVATSFPSGWLAPTKLVDDEPGGRAFDPDDPPYEWTDGRVEFLLTLWSGEVCDGSVVTDVLPVVRITESGQPDMPGDGLAINGSVSVEPNYTRGSTQRGRVVRFTVHDVAYPHGLAAGRHVDLTNSDTGDDVAGGGGPFRVSWTVFPRKLNGVCDATHPTTIESTLRIDRFLPEQPHFDTPVPFKPPADAGTTACAPLNGKETCPLRSAFPAYFPQHGRVIVSGTVTDPVTPPSFEDPDYLRSERSGIAAVVVRLFGNRRRVMKSYTFLNPECGITFEADPSITRCSESMPFSVDVTDQLKTGGNYGIDAYAIDRSGYRSPINPQRAISNENTNGPPAPAVQFYYLGNF
ncbi:MAG: hypothetical protein ABR552_10390 [Actinomycetota bacterium]